MTRRKEKIMMVLIGIVVMTALWMAVMWYRLPLNLAPLAAPHPIRLQTKEPAEGSIMLLEGYGGAKLTYRMFCAVESAARNHPQVPVYLLMTSNTVDDSPLLHGLTDSLSNLHVGHLDTERLFKDTPLQAWYARRAWEDSKWPTSHYNDALRWLLLWRYGGIYLDMDVVVTRPLSALPNCTGLESDQWAAAGVLKFSPSHPLIHSCLTYFAQHFDGQVWGANGPELITQVLKDRCGLELPSGRTPYCADVAVMPPRAFYPVPWWEWKRYVTDDPELSRDLLNDPQVLVLHVWNLHTSHALVDLASQQPYARAAQVFCPTTTAHAGNAM